MKRRVLAMLMACFMAISLAACQGPTGNANVDAVENAESAEGTDDKAKDNDDSAGEDDAKQQAASDSYSVEEKTFPAYVIKKLTDYINSLY